MLSNICCLWVRYIVKKFEHWLYIRWLLYRAVKLTNNTDPDKYGYSGYGIEFDTRSQFLLLNGKWGRNVFFGVAY